MRFFIDLSFELKRLLLAEAARKIHVKMVFIWATAV